MNTISGFLLRCDAFCQHRGYARSYLSRLIFNDGKTISALSQGRDITVGRLARAEVALARLEAGASEHAGAA